MKIKEIPVDTIHPDPDQPRKTFDKDAIRRLADTYETEGQMEPIEVDDDLVIVRGERRWRAAKLAGLKTVLASIRVPENRLRRQLIDEFHKNGIPIIERAKAVERFVVGFRRDTAKTSAKGGRPVSPVNESARILGVHHSVIRELLAMVEEPEVEKAIKEEKIQPTKAVELQKALGKERAKEFIGTSTKEELEALPIHTAIRPVRKAPEKVKDAIARGEVDFEDIESIADIIPEDEELQDRVIEEATVVKKARKTAGGELRKVVKGELKRATTVVDKSLLKMDQNRVQHFRSVWEDKVSRWIPAMVSGIKDDELRQEAIKYVERIMNHSKNLLEALGYVQIPSKTVIDVASEKDDE